MARILLDRVRQQLPAHVQSGFAPKKSTVDRVLAPVSSPSVCVTSALLAAYVNFPKAFDSVNRDVL